MRSLSLVLAVLGGCSWSMRTLPDHPQAGATYACETSRVRPVVDTIAAAAGLFVATVMVAATVDCQDGSTEGCSTLGLGYVEAAVLLAFAPSAVHGYRQAARCRAHQAGGPALVPVPAP